MITLKNSWTFILWFFRGRPVKKVIGGWCGCCGRWVEEAEFTFRDYWTVDNLYDLKNHLFTILLEIGKTNFAI